MLTKRRRQRKQPKKKGLISTCTTFLVLFFAVVLQDDNVKLPETSWLHVLWRKCCMWSCSLFFFSPPLILPCGRKHVCHFLTAAINKISFYSSIEIGLICFVVFFYLSLLLFLCYSFQCSFKN